MLLHQIVLPYPTHICKMYIKIANPLSSLINEMLKYKKLNAFMKLGWKCTDKSMCKFVSNMIIKYCEKELYRKDTSCLNLIVQLS